GDPSTELVMTAVHVRLDLDGLPDAKLGDLRFLKIRVDPKVIERANRHHALAHGHVVAAIHAFARNGAVDLRVYLAITEIQLRLVEIALGLQQLRLRSFDVRRILKKLGEDLVDVLIGITAE